MESKQHAPKKRVMCVSGAIQTQFFIIYITCVINFYIEKYILALDVAASCLFNLWKVKSASGVASKLLHARSLVCSVFPCALALQGVKVSALSFFCEEQLGNISYV